MSKTKLALGVKIAVGVVATTAVTGTAMVINHNSSTPDTNPEAEKTNTVKTPSITDSVNGAQANADANDTAKEKTPEKATAVTKSSDESAQQAPTVVSIQPGDTLWGIANAHGTTLQDLLAANPDVGTVIHPGDTIVLPTPATPATPKPETPKPETPKPETPKPETPKPETPKPETPKPETPKPETPVTPVDPSIAQKAEVVQQAESVLVASENTQAAIAQNVADAESALKEAKANVDSAQTAAEQAQTSVTNAEALVSQKQSAATELAAAKAAAEEALAAAESENVAAAIASAEQAFADATEAKTQTDIAIKAAKDAAEEAKAIANNAASTVAEAQNKLNVAASLKADAVAKIQASQDAVNAARAAVDAAKAALATAEKAAQEASTQAEAAIQKPEQLGDDVFETHNVVSDGSAFDSAKLANGDYKLLSSTSETIKVPTGVPGQYTLKHVTTATYRVINRQTVTVAVNKDLSGNVLTDLTGYVLDHKNDAATSHDVVADNGDVTTYIESVQYWRAATNNDVVVNVDESGDTITPSDAYKFVSTSTHVDTTPSGDTITTQTNVYHKIVNHTTTVDKHVDESGNVITPSNDYKLVGTEVSDAVVTETAANGDTTSVVTTTHTYHKIVNHTTAVDKHVDESGNVITPSNDYKLIGTEVSDAVVTETAANGDTTSVVTTTHTYHKIVTSTAPDKIINVDASGNTLVNTTGMVQQSSTTKQESVTKDNGDIVITNVTTTVWKAVEHKPQQVGETQYEMNLFNSSIAGDYANASRIDGSVNLDYYELVNEVPERTNVQANGDYTLVMKSYFKLTDNGYRHFTNIEMAKALDAMKRKLWTMFPDVAKTLVENGVTEGITAMSESEQAPGANAQAAAQHVVDSGVLEHTNYKGMQQIIASGSGVYGSSYTDSSYTLIMKNVKTACDLYWDELDALKEVVETGDSSADYGHLVMIMTVSKVYTAVASNSENTRSWVATNGI